MGYVVLALKSRPQQFDEVLGQEHITSVLKSAIRKGRVANAYLFTGPRGVGKTSTARIFAKALNCGRGVSPAPCGKCGSCADITRGSSLDVLEIDGASNRGIDNIRELRENVKFAPAVGPHKIYIIDEVHQVTRDAFNALLKTLEEPPEHVKFFFCTTEPNKVPATILSRCQRFDFRRVASQSIAGRLQEIARKEKVKAKEAALLTIARVADGSVRDAVSILDKLIASSGGEITVERVEKILGLMDRETIRAFLTAIADSDTNTAFRTVGRVIEEGGSVSTFLTAITGSLRALLILKSCPDGGEILDLTEEELEEARALAERFREEEVLHLIELVTILEERVKRVLSQRALLEAFCVRMIQAKDRVALGTIWRDLGEMEKRLLSSEGTGGRRGAEARPRTVPSPRAGAGDIEAAWPEIVERMGKSKPIMKGYLLRARPARLEDEKLLLQFPEDCSHDMEMLSDLATRQTLEKIISEKAGRQVRIEMETTPDRHPRPGDAPRPKKKSTNNIKKEPIIQSAIDIFDAQIVDFRK